MAVSVVKTVRPGIIVECVMMLPSLSKYHRNRWSVCVIICLHLLCNAKLAVVVCRGWWRLASLS